MTSLILEGGGMRGVYAAGILEYLLEAAVPFTAVYAVSAGACNGTSFISQQRGRNRTVYVDYVNDPRYLSVKNFMTKGQLFGMDFIFDEIPNQHVPFDYEAFWRNDVEFVVGTTNIATGEPHYFRKSQCGDELFTALRASSSLPFIAPVVKVNELPLLDGGLADPIPVHIAIEDGHERHVAILTRERGYEKERSATPSWLYYKYRRYPQLVALMKRRHHIYNQSLHTLAQLEKKGAAFIFAPEEKLAIGRIERRADALQAAYEVGYEQAKRQFSQLASFLQL